jgi:hypothetical protein
LAGTASIARTPTKSPNNKQRQSKASETVEYHAVMAEKIRRQLAALSADAVA